MIQTNQPGQRIDGRDANGERWAAQALPAISEDGYPDLITIRTLDGNLHLDHADAAELALWLFSITKPSVITFGPSGYAAEVPQPDEPKPINCDVCGKPLGMTTALEVVDRLCAACWEKAW